MNNTLISVVIPIYNAESYLEYCLASVCLQTYKSIEIILVNDGSTDLSKEICLTWCQYDSRIKYFEQKNQGAGIARNYGVKKAMGKYVFFLDSDDWIEKDCIQEMYQCIEKNNADICSSDHYLFDEQSKEYTRVSSPLNNEKYDVSNYYMTSFSWKLIKKDLFTRYDIRQPGGILEDFAMYPIVLLVAKRRCYIAKPFYYYRRNTGVSTMDKMTYVFKYPAAMRIMIAESKRIGLWPGNRDLLKKIAQYHMNETLGNLQRQGLNELYTLARDEFEKCMRDLFESKIWLVGSYNLSRITSFIEPNYKLMGEDLKYYFGYSSLISLMEKNETIELTIQHDNKFRNDSIYKDFHKVFQNIRVGENDYLFIDLLEERFDLVWIKNCIVTASEVFDESNLTGIGEKRIKAMSSEAFEMWKEACIRFVGFVEKFFLKEHIIIIESYLTNKKVYRDESEEPWLQDVKSINHKLHIYYNYLKQLMPYARVIEIPEEMNFTDGDSKYGYSPAYLNINAHKKLGESIKKYIKEI